MSLAQNSRTLVSQSDSALNPKARIPRSVFRNTWSRKTCFDAGYLIPFLLDEILPGDHVKYECSIYARIETLIFPMMDQQRLDTHFFFIPNRLVWDDWKKLMGERKPNPGSSTIVTIPNIGSTVGGNPLGTLWDHFGLPTAGQVDPAGQIVVSVLPFRAYNLMYNEWFRDENTQNSLVVETGNTTANPLDYQNTALRAKSHDYFTTCLPNPQSTTGAGGNGTTGAIAPLSGVAAVGGIGASGNAYTAGPASVYTANLGLTPFAWFKGPIGPGAQEQFYVQGSGPTGNPFIYADLASSAGAGVSISQLRQAWAIQQLLELKNRSGTRYIENIKAQFGVTVPDYRLQRPEYIGGGQSPLNITPIAQTTPTTGVAVGYLGAAGTVAGNHSASYAAQEHGYIIGVLSVKTELSYQQGVHKSWKRQTDLDFYTPPLADLPDQAVTTGEIWARGTAQDNTVFGYQERWQEYRMRYNDITGKMKSYVTGTLDAWHLAQRFNTAPAIGAGFTVDFPPMERVLAASTLAINQQYKADINYRRTIARAMPTFSVPATMGRF